jgi:hypothetical protein
MKYISYSQRVIQRRMQHVYNQHPEVLLSCQRIRDKIISSENYDINHSIKRIGETRSITSHELYVLNENVPYQKCMSNIFPRVIDKKISTIYSF